MSSSGPRRVAEQVTFACEHGRDASVSWSGSGCGRLVLGQGAKVLSGVAQRVCPPHPGDEVVGQKEGQGDQRDGEEGEEVNGEVEMSADLEPMQCDVI